MTHLTCRDGTTLSRLTFGTMQFGGRADAQASRVMFDTARAAGINHFDTAVGYADGRSEALLGPMIAPDRDRLYLATKVAFHGGAGDANIRAQFDISRRQSGLDTVDLLYLHRWDAETPLEKTFETLARLQDAGLIRHIGVSNYAAWQVMKAQAVCAALGTRIDVMQPMYNLVKRQAEVEILPMAADQGILVCPYSPLGGGLLTGKYARGDAGRLTDDAMYAARYGQDWMHLAAARLADLAAEVGVDPATLAVAWVAAHRTAPSPIVSARSAEQLAPSLAAQDLVLSPALRDRMTALSPTPPPATDRLEEV
ncbi:Predicted oxidoreductase [Loktanella fryxellensis]|uniref:Predicted oxidoreductase n=1 Tax=Loktanella fryxellensis TaxID=245187 RepID=A0A1H8D6H7_9RHOB|nr:aldo/keto reductase [Loktanella fryxellensis]SEN02802.1 Predicted oxidoreductase [Loktanella fryxellensis]